VCVCVCVPMRRDAILLHKRRKFKVTHNQNNQNRQYTNLSVSDLCVVYLDYVSVSDLCVVYLD